MTEMTAIAVADLAKTYRYHRKEPGLRGSLRSLVRRRMRETRAVEGVSFRIEARPGPNGATRARRSGAGNRAIAWLAALAKRGLH